MSSSVAQRLIGEEEGCVATAYHDSKGFLTIAIGCLVDPSVRGAGLCQAAIDAQFAHDSAQAIEDAEHFPNYDKLNDVQQGVVESMCFQMGTAPLNWPDFHAAMTAGNWLAAAAAGLDSKWATETPVRAKREMWMLGSGTWLDHGASVPTPPPAAAPAVSAAPIQEQ